MKAPRSSKVVLCAIAAVLVLLLGFLIFRRQLVQQPLAMHAAMVPLTSEWNRDQDPPVDRLAAINPQIMARYHPEREIERDSYVREHYGEGWRTHLETQRLELGETVAYRVAVSADGFTEIVLSGGQFRAPVRGRIIPGECTLTARSMLWLTATVRTPKRDDRLLSEDWWISQYKVEEEHRGYRIDGKVVLPGQGRTVALTSAPIELDSSFPRNRSLAEDGTLFCAMTPWRPLLDVHSPSREKLGELFPDVWQSYAADAEDLPQAPRNAETIRVSKEHRTFTLDEVETAELAWPVESESEPGPAQVSMIRQAHRVGGLLVAKTRTIHVENLEITGPFFTFMTSRSGHDMLEFTSCRDVAGILERGKTYRAVKDAVRVVQVGAVTLEADFWVTRVRAGDGTWRVEREQFHDYTVSIGPQEQRVYGAVFLGWPSGKPTGILEAKHYRSSRR